MSSYQDGACRRAAAKSPKHQAVRSPMSFRDHCRGCAIVQSSPRRVSLTPLAVGLPRCRRSAFNVAPHSTIVSFTLPVGSRRWCDLTHMSPLGNMPRKSALTVSLPSQLTTVGDWPRPRQGSRGLFSSWRFNSTFRISIPSWMMPDHHENLRDDRAAPKPGDISISR